MRNKRLQKRLNEKNQIIEQAQQQSAADVVDSIDQNPKSSKPKKEKKPKKAKNISNVSSEDNVSQIPNETETTKQKSDAAPENTQVTAQPDRSTQQDAKKTPSKPKQKKFFSKKSKASPEDFNVLELGATKYHARSIPTKTIFYKIGTILIVICCVYVAFLTYGVFMTDYVYDENGNVVAERMSVNDIKKNREFKKVLDYYYRAREIYEKTLRLDYELSQNAEDSILISTEYEELLTPLSNLLTQLRGFDVSAKFTQYKTMLDTWLDKDMSIYLQNISAAIAQNNTEKANHALQDKERTYNDFYLITQNLIALSGDVKSIDISDLKEWSPSNYIEKHITGVEN